MILDGFTSTATPWSLASPVAMPLASANSPLFVLTHPECQALDDGEMHLLAWLHAQGLLPNALILISTADKAAIVATGRIGWLDSVVSLEHLAQHSGVTRGQIDSLARHYRTQWLDEIKFKVRFGIIP